MAAKTVDPARLDQAARARWADLGAPPAPVRDEDERVVAVPSSERLAGITRRAAAIGISDGLAEAVAALLRADGVDAAAERERIDPEQAEVPVIAVRGPGGLVAPLHPGGRTVRVYPAGEDTLLVGPPVVEVDVAAEPDRWVTAANLAAALREHLA